MRGKELDILLIEDNPGDVRLVEEMLDEATARGSAGGADVGVRDVRHAGRLDDGLRRLDEGTVDVLLLDLGLPDSTGIATLETVRERSREVPIVVLTGLADETVGDRAVQRGAQEYLVKDELTPRLLRRSLRHAIERKRFERTQAALHRASRDLFQAESKAAVCELAVEVAVDVFDLSGVVVYLFDDAKSELRPAAATEGADDAFGEVSTSGPGDDAVAWRTFVTGETNALEDVAESEPVRGREPPLESGIWIPLGSHGVMAAVSEEPFEGGTRRFADHLAATTEAALDRVDREESLRDHERELAEQNRRLEALNRMNELIREIDGALVQARTRDAIEQAVCDRLTREGRFAFAWLGEVVDDERLRPRTWAGADQGYLDAVSLATDDADGPPAVTAASTGAVALTPNVASDLQGAPWRRAALARNFGSVISVPLTYDDLSYGVLTVFASEPNAFDASFEETFAELGETIANAMNAVETRQALLTDTVVELELAIYDPDDPLGRLAREAGCRIEYDGIVPQSDGTSRVFFTETGASVGSIRAVVEGARGVRGLRHVGDAGDDDAPEHRFEMTVSGPTLPSTLVECGAAARSLQVDDSGARVVVELPDNTDVRTFVDRLEGTYPETELLARRDAERPDQSRQAFRTTLTEELTDRQLEALMTAYHSGYFQWPRDRSGEEVAEALGITQPTFNGHLRAAERKLCAMLFDGASSPPAE